MKVEFLEQFEKDLATVRDSSILDAVASAISSLEDATTLREVRNLKKLKGYRNIFRIRIRDYRIGFILENGIVELARFLPRKDIYRLFP